MENICILDCETTGLDPTKGIVLEVAAILYNIPTKTVLAQCSTLFPAQENPAFEVNKIKPEALQKVYPTLTNKAISTLIHMLEYSDAILAHNAEFDRKWVKTIPNDELKKLFDNTKWICTKNDVTWPIRKSVPLSLISICSELGVPIVNAHRALSDCTLLLNALECIDDVAYFLNQSGEGKQTYYANVGYEKRQLVKDAGFKWDNEKKVWFNRLSENEARHLPFLVSVQQS